MASRLIAGVGLMAAFSLFGCGEEPKKSDEQQPRSSGAEAAQEQKPAPFDKGPVKIAVLQYSGAGDDSEQWASGAKDQGDKIGFDIQLSDARGNIAKLAGDVDAAIASGVAGIVVHRGLAGPLCPLIRKATEGGIAVVVYDLEIGPCAPKAVQTAQDDSSLATLVLSQMANDIGDSVPIGYVTVLRIAQFDRRDEIWKKIRAQHRWQQKFVTGKLTANVAADNTPMVASMLKTNSQVKAIFAAHDELAKATLSAIEQHGLASKVALYGLGISDSDVELMTKEGSAWKATAGTDSKSVGAAVIRTLALELTGKLGTKEVKLPGTLVTQAFLAEQGIKSMDDLRTKLPAVNLGEVSSISWIP